MTKKVVIIGGGFAGSVIAKSLSHNKHLDITLIDIKEYFEHTPAILRAVVNFKHSNHRDNNSYTTPHDNNNHAGSTNDGTKESDKITSSCTMPHASYFSGRLIVGEVLEVSDRAVKVRCLSKKPIPSTLSNPVLAPGSPKGLRMADSHSRILRQSREDEETVVEFDFLAICTGSLYPGFVKPHEEKLADRETNLMRECRSLKNAKRILVVGGGPVGVELLGDINYQYPDKKLTLVHSRPMLLDRTHPKAQYVAQQTMETYAKMILHQRIIALQVNDDQISVRKTSKKSPFLLLNDGNRTYSYSRILKNVEKESTIQYVTNEGLRDNVDKVFFCCGSSSSATFMHKNFSSQLDDEYRIKVNNFLQVEGCSNIFAAGDITFFKEEKLVERAVRQAEIVAENIARLAKGQPVKSQYFSQPKPGAQVISVGPQQGVFMMWGSVICTGDATHLMKTSFLGHHIKRLLTPPVDAPKTKNPQGIALRPKIAVLGQGGMSVEVVRYLARRGVDCSVIVPNGSQALSLKDADVKNHTRIVSWDPANPSSLTTALSGMEAVLLTCAIGETMVDECENFVKACQAASVGCILKCTQGAIDAELRHHYLAEWNFQIENLLKACGVPYVVIRHTHFLTTLTMFCAAHIRVYRTMVWPLGSGGVRWVDMRDVVRSVCKVLVDPKQHYFRTYNLTGAVEHTAEDICHALSAVLAEKIHLVNCPPNVAVSQLTDFGIANKLAQVLAQMHTQHTAGSVQPGDVERLTGKKPRMLSRWLKKNMWRFTDYPPPRNQSIRIDFQEVLFNEEASQQFLEYLIANNGDKNFLFWKAVEEFKTKLNDGIEMVSMAHDIVSQFVRKDSPTGIYLSLELQQTLTEKIQQNQIESSMFDEAQCEVGFSMEDWFPGFRKFERERREAAAKKQILMHMQPPKAITNRTVFYDKNNTRQTGPIKDGTNASPPSSSSPSTSPPPSSQPIPIKQRRGSESSTNESGSECEYESDSSDPDQPKAVPKRLLPRTPRDVGKTLVYPNKPLPPLPPTGSERPDRPDRPERPTSPLLARSLQEPIGSGPRFSRSADMYNPGSPKELGRSATLTNPLDAVIGGIGLRNSTSEPLIAATVGSKIQTARSPLINTSSPPQQQPTTQPLPITSNNNNNNNTIPNSNVFVSSVVSSFLPMSPSSSPTSASSPYMGQAPSLLLTSPAAMQTAAPSIAPVVNLPAFAEVYFDGPFREAFRMHLENEAAYGGAGENLAQFLSLIADITRYKSVFEDSDMIKSSDVITVERFNSLNVKPKLPLRISLASNKKYLQESDMKYPKAKKRALKIINTYLSSDSKALLSVPNKIREKLIRHPLTPRIGQAMFNKLQSVCLARLELELPRFAQSLEYVCYKDIRNSQKEIVRIKSKIDEVEVREEQLKIELHILQLQHKNLRTLFQSKKLMELRKRPKTTFLCGFENFSAMSKLWESLPVCDIVIPSPDSNIVVSELSGETGLETETSWQNYSCGHVTSTYPPKEDGITRQGDPICDVFRLIVTSGYSLIMVADGCSWGRSACDASRNASEAFMSYTKQHLTSDITNLRLLGQLLIQALEGAHQAIFSASKNMQNMQYQNWDNWDVGTTTILGGLVIPISNNEYGFVCVSVGDCKVFRYSQREGTVQDLTVGNRTNLMDARDPGGRIGPYLPRGRADLRNLMLITCPCNKKDIIFVASDGVHDNFDPQMLGIPPRKLGMEVDTWEQAEIEFPSQAQKLKCDFMEKTIYKTITKQSSNVTPQSVTRSLIKYCLEVTESSRKWMLDNPHNKLPEDYSSFPGKMDHTTCLSLLIDNYQ